MNIESAARSEFAGKDGFHHFWGKVVPQSAWKKENDLKSLSGQQSHRAKIIIVGYDSFDVTEIEILDGGNRIIGKNRGTINTNNGIIIEADQFEFVDDANVRLRHKNFSLCRRE